MIILVGPSASGKTEIAKILTTKYGFKKFVTSTTRAPRVNEINGLDYNFLTEDTFIKMRNNNEFIESTFYNNNYYGTEKKLIDDKTVLIVESIICPDRETCIYIIFNNSAKRGFPFCTHFCKLIFAD